MPDHLRALVASVITLTLSPCIWRMVPPTLRSWASRPPSRAQLSPRARMSGLHLDLEIIRHTAHRLAHDPQLPAQLRIPRGLEALLDRAALPVIPAAHGYRGICRAIDDGPCALRRGLPKPPPDPPRKSMQPAGVLESDIRLDQPGRDGVGAQVRIRFQAIKLLGKIDVGELRLRVCPQSMILTSQPGVGQVDTAKGM